MDVGPEQLKAAMAELAEVDAGWRKGTITAKQAIKRLDAWREVIGGGNRKEDLCRNALDLTWAEIMTSEVVRRWVGKERDAIGSDAKSIAKAMANIAYLDCWGGKSSPHRPLLRALIASMGPALERDVAANPQHRKFQPIAFSREQWAKTLEGPLPPERPRASFVSRIGPQKRQKRSATVKRRSKTKR